MRLAVLLVCLTIAWPAVAKKRVALVIGNAAYKHTPELNNTKNDAADMAAAFEALGFEIVKGVDLDKREMERTIRRFSRKLQKAQIGAFFYAGHGIQVNGVNYLVPTDAELSTSDALDFEMIRLNVVQRVMENATRTNVIFLDACRDNPLSRNLARALGTRSASIGRGLAQVEAGLGTLISYATQPGNVALDGDARNSPYTAALKRHIGLPGEELTSVLIRVRNDVIEATGGNQIPWDQSALRSRLFLGKARMPYQERLRRLTIASNSITELQAYRRLEPSLAALINRRIRGLKAKAEREAREEAEARRKDAAGRKAREETKAKQRAEQERKNQEARRKAEEEKARQAAKEARLVLLAEQQRQAERARTTEQNAERERKRQGQREQEKARRKYIVDLALQIQKRLKELGCYRGRLDGEFGPASRAAWQRAIKVSFRQGPVRQDDLKRLASLPVNICKPSAFASTSLKPKGQPGTPKRSSKASRGRPSRSTRSARTKRPDPSSYSSRVWSHGSVSSGSTVSKNTKYGRLTCTGGGRGIRRRCRWN